ncbi:hypothetical protein JCM31739_17510 [Faecalimonas canis]
MRKKKSTNAWYKSGEKKADMPSFFDFVKICAMCINIEKIYNPKSYKMVFNLKD